MKRRDFVSSVLAAGLAAPAIGATGAKAPTEQDHGGHGGGNDDGRKSRVVEVSFGRWGRTLPFDRFGAPNVVGQNVHEIWPNPIKAHVGDAIVFHISGLHNPQVYGPGTQPQDILFNLVDASAPAIIDFKQQTAPGVFRGLDPRVLNAGTAAAGGIQDRVEAMNAPSVPGRYLVICGVKVHFVAVDANGNPTFLMFAFMDVEPADN